MENNKKLFFVLSLCLFYLLTSCDTAREHIVIELSDYDEYSKMDISGQSLFIPVGKEDQINQIIEVNLHNKSENIIYETKKPQNRINSLMVNDKYMTWVESDIWGAFARLMLLERKTNETKVLIEEDEEGMGFVTPYLNDSKIGWIDEDLQVIIYDIENNEYHTVAKTHDHITDVYIDSDVILWGDMIDGKNYVVMYDMRTEKTEQYETEYGVPRDFYIENNTCIALEYSSRNNWGENRLTHTDFMTKEHRVISDAYVSSFQIIEDDVYYILEEADQIIRYNTKTNKEEQIELTAFKQPFTLFRSSDGQYLIADDNENDSGDIRLEIISMK